MAETQGWARHSADLRPAKDHLAARIPSGLGRPFRVAVVCAEPRPGDLCCSWTRKDGGTASATEMYQSGTEVQLEANQSHPAEGIYKVLTFSLHPALSFGRLA